MLSSNFATEEREEVVVLLKVLASEVNEGYHNYSNWIISNVNGEEIRSLEDLVKRVRAESADPFVVFSSKNDQQIVLDRVKAEAAHRQILATYRIQSDRSDDLK